MSLNLGLSVNARGGYRVQPITGISATYAAVYGLRQTVQGYAGNLIRVRRSSDNAETDIGPAPNGTLNTAALLAYVGSGSGFVVTWYDQSGNGRNATQSTAGSQPRIVNAGTLETQNGRPSIRFLGAGYSLPTASFTAFGSGFTRCVVGAVATNTSFSTFGGKTTTTEATPFDMYNNQFGVGSGTNTTLRTLTTSIAAASGFRQWTFQADSSGMNAFTNGAANLVTTTAPAQYGDSNVALTIGSRADGVTSLNGYVSEDVYLTTVASTADRQIVERNQGAYHFITVA